MLSYAVATYWTDIYECGINLLVLLLARICHVQVFLYRYVDKYHSSFCRTWCIQPVGGAAGTNGRTPCPSSLHFLGLSTADEPGRWCLPCATVNFSSAPRGLIETSQPAKQQQRDRGMCRGMWKQTGKRKAEMWKKYVKRPKRVWMCCWGFVTLLLP